MPKYMVTNVYTAAVSHIVYADNEDMAKELGKAHYDELGGSVEYDFTVVDDVVSDASDLCGCSTV
jgi:hypothetical protein